jgi:hypothetical protein
MNSLSPDFKSRIFQVISRLSLGVGVTGSQQESLPESITTDPARNREAISFLSRAALLPDPRVLQEFNKAKSPEALSKLFVDLADQLNLESANSATKNSPEEKFYEYLQSDKGAEELEKKISGFIKNELGTIQTTPSGQDGVAPINKLISDFDTNIVQLFLSLQSLNLKQSAQKLLENYNSELDKPVSNVQTIRQFYPFELSFTEQISLLFSLMTNRNDNELELSDDDNEEMLEKKMSEVQLQYATVELFEHHHLSNILDIRIPKHSTEENETTPAGSSISNTINQLIEREDFNNADSLEILNAYLAGTATNHQTEANKLLNKSLSFYFRNINEPALYEDLINLTNLFHVATSKGIIPVDDQKALGENFLDIFGDIKLRDPNFIKQSLMFLLSSTALDKINNEKYSNFISDNMDSINELIEEKPIFIIKNIDLKKINDTDLQGDLQSLISADIHTKKHLPDIRRNINGGNIDLEQLFKNTHLNKFARMVLAAADKGFITQEALSIHLPNYVEVGNRIQAVDNLNSLADQTSSTELEEKAGIDHLIEEILEQASVEGEEFDSQDQDHLFKLNLVIISFLQEVREKDPTHFRRLINQSLNPERLVLPDDFQDEDFQDDAINPFNHLLLTKAFCDPTKKLYQGHNSAEHDVRKHSFTVTQEYIERAINLYRSEQKDRLKIDQETPSTENEEHKLNEELILSLINKSSSDPDAHNQSIESITDVYFNLLANHYFTAANHLLEGEIIKAFKPNEGLETESAEIQQHLLKIYTFARDSLIIYDIRESHPTLKPFLDNFLGGEGTN